MIPDQVDLARRAVACPRWRWIPGMRAIGKYLDHPVRIHNFGENVQDLDDMDAGDTYLRWQQPIIRGDQGYDGPYLPDLTDPATLGCLLALVREAHGPATVARLVGVNGRGGQEWAICDRAPAVDGWHLAAPALGYWESEAEALVAALENGGGGA